MAKKFVPRGKRSWPSIAGSSKLRASRAMARLEDFSRLASEWVWETDAQGHITYLSERVKDSLGFIPEQIAGKTFKDFGVFYTKGGNVHTMDMERPFRDVRFKTLNEAGDVRILKVSGLPYYNPESWSFEGSYGICDDVTEREQNIIALHEAKEQADKANAAKSTFLSSMSHELRTPLNAIMGFGQMMVLDQHEPLTAKHQDYMKNILDSGSHLLNLVSEVLELARIETGDLKVELEDVKLPQIIKESISMVETAAQDRKVGVYEVDIDKSDLVVRADPFRLKQVVVNLLSNAVKFGPKGSEIFIQYGMWDEWNVRIFVHDDGPGIPADKRAEVFAPFERLGLESSVIAGVGVGLTLVKRLVERMNGSVGFDSGPEYGTTFWVNLPLSPKEQMDLELDDDQDAGADKPIPQP
jgi:PAS domain S-box-containing protein